MSPREVLSERLPPMHIIQADLTLVDDAFVPDLAVAIAADGTIERVESASGTATLRLSGQALLPGMINAHSHAFQRALRGRTERFGAIGGNFWSWREQMYALAEEMDASRLRRVCVQAFREMLSRGITTVGEFHYLHHDDSGKGYALDNIVLEAAAEAGIRIVLLNTYYTTGGIGQPLAGAQRRFGTPSVPEFLEHCQRLAERVDSRTQQIGLAAHSIRAVPIDDIIQLVRAAEQNGWVLHMHVEEQVQELKECADAFGTTPMRLLLEQVDLGPFFTAVHCTHTFGQPLEEFLESGGNVCICPTTEADLGDGIPDMPTIMANDGAVCLGSDSNVRIDLIEELRWLEHVQRVSRRERGVCRDAEGNVAATLWRCATRFGARSLGINAGTISAGRHADLFTIDLNHPMLSEVPPEQLLDALVFAGDGGLVRRVCVGGKWIV
ncbi:MAG TPA: formimidoylglutamate deiminase [Phycisphaerae bacterium]|jgi:formimidoylglutamate deiminase